MLSCIAVGAGPHVFIYRRLRPYYKLTCGGRQVLHSANCNARRLRRSLPRVPVAKEEEEAWEGHRRGGLNADALVDALAKLRCACLPYPRPTALHGFTGGDTAKTGRC